MIDKKHINSILENFWYMIISSLDTKEATDTVIKNKLSYIQLV